MPHQQVCSVPVVPSDLRRQESVLQLLGALETLGSVVDTVFGRISARVSENRDRLINVNNRCVLW